MKYHPLFIAFLNTVYILTDDQDVKLNSLEVQPAVHSLLVEQGLFFNNAFVTTPVCCPSRYVCIPWHTIRTVDCTIICRDGIVLTQGNVDSVACCFQKHF